MNKNFVWSVAGIKERLQYISIDITDFILQNIVHRIL